MLLPTPARSLAVILLVATVSDAGQDAPATDPRQMAAQARRLTTTGKIAEAVALFKNALKADPELFDAHLGLGIALDLQGEYEPARHHLGRALSIAPENARGTALGAMAVSYLFESKVAEAAKFYEKQFDLQMAGQALDGAAATANAIGRVFLETGDVDRAEQWYRTGYETAKKLPGLPQDQVDLWEMRWLHAQSRLAARRGRKAEADRHAAALEALVNKGGENAKQEPILRYLLGYNAFHLGDLDRAASELARADQADPFILALQALTCERQKDTACAREAWTKVLAQTGHSLQNALVRDRARAALK
jgi:tetratricopeptide (TPR) repeat protein